MLSDIQNDSFIEFLNYKNIKKSYIIYYSTIFANSQLDQRSFKKSAKHMFVMGSLVENYWWL